MEQKNEAVYLLNGETYLHLQENGAGVGFATYNKVTGEPLENGQISKKNLPPELTIQEAREQILEAHHMEKGRRLLQDYDLVMDRAADAEELGLDQAPSTLEKLAGLANTTAKPTPTQGRKTKNEPEL